MLPLVYTNAKHIREGRSPASMGVDEDGRSDSHLLPQELALFAGSTRDESWILDVEENTIGISDEYMVGVPAHRLVLSLFSSPCPIRKRVCL